MDTKKLAPLPTNVTEGQRRRTLRGLVGRLDHVETLEKGRAFALVDLRNEVRTLRADVGTLTLSLTQALQRIATIEAHPALSVPAI